MHQIFLSHSSSDKSTARDIHKALAGPGLKIWLDETELRAGDSVIARIEAALDKIDTFLILLSSSSIESKWVQAELKIAIAKELFSDDVRVIPVLIEKVQIPTILIDKKCVDMTSGEKFKPGIEFIRRSISTTKKSFSTPRAETPISPGPSRRDLILKALSPVQSHEYYSPSNKKIKDRVVINCKIPHDEIIYGMITYAIGWFGITAKKGDRCICVTERGVYAHLKDKRVFCEYKDLDKLDIRLYT